MSDIPKLNKKRKQQLQVYNNHGNQIVKLLQNEKEKIQESINKNNNIVQIKNLKLAQHHQQKQCQYCEFVGIARSVYLHMKHNHRKEFLEQVKDKTKYQQCETCQKIFKTQNIKQHQVFCAIKKNAKEAAKAKNMIDKMNNQQFYGKQYENDDFYNLLISQIKDTRKENEKSDFFSPNNSHPLPDEALPLQKQVSEAFIFKATRKSHKQPQEVIVEEAQESDKPKIKNLLDLTDYNPTNNTVSQIRNEVSNLDLSVKDQTNNNTVTQIRNDVSNLDLSVRDQSNLIEQE